MYVDENSLENLVKNKNVLLISCFSEISKRIVGQKDMVKGIFMGILAGGHVLLEGVPGLAKTLVIKTVADVIDASFKRIQFTPDLLPADLVGTMIYRPQTGEFVPRKGPVFSNIILADEINRAPAKVQSALLEAMQERQVTLGDQTFHLDEPFFVLATQNPIEQEGTYPLPEAQLDRFILKIRVNYPDFQDEVGILKLIGIDHDISVRSILNKYHLKEIRDVIDRISVDERVMEYIVSLVSLSRQKPGEKSGFLRFIEFGASPRASLYLLRCAKVNAFFEGRVFVIPEDIKKVAQDVLRHRIILNYEAESEGLETEDIISEMLGFVPVP
ncbi:MAG: MoxR family ATPase [Spirochaetales bacterium]|nr:MoxR family ATPase [Spirochaetales bacterium]